MRNIDSAVQIGVDEEVVTAGIELGGGIRSPYPKGLLLGQVVDVQRDANDVVQTAFIAPAASLDSFELALVITDYQGGLPSPGRRPSRAGRPGRCPRARCPATRRVRARRGRIGEAVGRASARRSGSPLRGSLWSIRRSCAPGVDAPPGGSISPEMFDGPEPTEFPPPSGSPHRTVLWGTRTTGWLAANRTCLSSRASHDGSGDGRARHARTTGPRKRRRASGPAPDRPGTRAPLPATLPDDEGHRSGRWHGHPAVPADDRHQQAPAADLRPADDLLPDRDPGRDGDPRGHGDRRRQERRRRRGAARRRAALRARPDVSLPARALGIAHAIGLARDFVGDDAFCCVLGDNILRGEPLAENATAIRGRRPGEPARSSTASRTRSGSAWPSWTRTAGSSASRRSPSTRRAT